MTISYNKLKQFKVEKKEGVLSVIPVQPGGWKYFLELNEIWKSIPDDPEIRAVVFFASAGPKAPPGFAIHPPLDDPNHPLRNLELAGPAIHGGGAYHMGAIKTLLEVPQPIIAAVQGRCGGLTANLALLCDIVIGADDLEINDAHIATMVPGDGGCVIWPLLINVNRAKEYLLTGDVISATEAKRLGLVNRVVPVAELQDTALTLAKRIANERPPLAVRFTKHVLNRVIAHQMELVWELADAYQTLTSITEDAKEARRARTENRPPQFTGK